MAGDHLPEDLSLITDAEALRLFRGLTRVFAEPQSIMEGIAHLDESQAGHLTRVLRKSAGDPVGVLDGAGSGWIARLESCSKKSASARLLRAVPNPDLALRRVETVIGPLKGDRMDLVLQKCAEIGVCRFHIVPFERGVARVRADEAKQARYRAILRAAARQCGAFTIPDVRIWDDIEAFFPSALPALRYIAWEEEAAVPAAEIVEGSEPCVLATGPEGGLSAAEAALWVRSGFQTVSLGQRVLRAETAPIVMAGLALCARALPTVAP